MNDAKALHDKKRWDVVGHDMKKVLWGVVNDRVVKELTGHDGIGLWGFDFNLFDEY